MSKKTILVVDDEYLIRLTLQKNLEKQGYGVVVAETGEEALQKIAAESPDLLLLDIKLPGIDGFEVLEKALALDRSLIIVMITALEEVDQVVRAIRSGAFDYITKPFDFHKVHLSIEKGFEASHLKKEVKYLREQQTGQSGYANIIGESEKMRDILATTQRVAQSDGATVLIQGESGTGKEMIAQAVHYQSQRANMPFITVNCAGFPEHLLENELCGHEKGAYTNAHEVKKGLLEVADGGSLFLDEIGDMNEGMQAKLLRLIEQQTFRRMGGVKDISVDVRIITATNKDLRKLMLEGKFREDLYYRINIIAIYLPPLRERRDDVLLLAQFYLKKYNMKFHRYYRDIADEAKRLLMDYDWPGNVRELKNVIERAVIIGDGDTLLASHLPKEITDQAFPRQEGIKGILLPTEGLAMDTVEESLVTQALEMTGGNQTKAAKLLNISRDSLRNRMQKFGIAMQPGKK